MSEFAPHSESFDEEFERLKQVASTKSGYETLNEAFMRALNYVKSGAGWIKTSVSDGSSVAGFAIEPMSGEYEIGEKGRRHDKPHYDLQYRLTTEDHTGGPYAYLNVREGRLAYLPAWKFPLALISGGFNRKSLEAVESQIREKKIGLPIRGLRKGKD